MKNWEDIVKDKLEGYESPLPEGSLAEFRARRDAAGSAAAKRSPLLWIVPTAVAAGLAAILFLRQPGEPENGAPTIQQPTTTVAVVTNSVEVVETASAQPLIAQAVAPKAIRQPAVQQQEAEAAIEAIEESEAVIESREEIGAAQATEGVDSAEQTVQTAQTTQTEQSGRTTISTTSPFIPDVTTSRHVNMKVGPAVGVVAGGGLVAAVAGPVLTHINDIRLSNALVPQGVGSMRQAHDGYINGDVSNSGSAATSSDPGNNPGLTPGTDPKQGTEISPTADLPEYPLYSGAPPSHYFPFRTGLSLGIPVTERLKLTTGFDYSLYRSSYYTFPKAVKYTQRVQYLGIPLRLDWTLASNRWLDVYIGGGFEPDVCISATYADKRIDGDKLSFSLLAAGGVQFNITKWLGLYVEPELSWTAPSKNRKLETYRTVYPVMFSVSTGLRFNL